jgi:hypothetical protein
MLIDEEYVMDKALIVQLMLSSPLVLFAKLMTLVFQTLLVRQTNNVLDLIDFAMVYVVMELRLKLSSVMMEILWMEIAAQANAN